MGKTIFSHELRMLLCAQCGAPIEGTIAGGQVSCSYCRASMVVGPRDERSDQASAAAQPTMSEAQRFEQLRMQDGRPLLPPPALAHLVSGGTLSQAHVPQALSEFQRARHEIAQGGSFAAAERLYFLALMLYGALSEQRQDAQVRALLETARDLLTDPRHRQAIHGMLARNAARVGDFDAAEAWLRLCNPYAADIHMDTAYRFSRAYISTARHDYQTVLQVLGSRIDDVPIADGQDLITGVLRANALERMGHAQEAAQQLAQLSASNPMAAQMVERCIAANAELSLCPHSFPLSRQQAQAMQSGAIRTRGGFNVGKLLLLIFLFDGIALALMFGAWAVLPATAMAVVQPIAIIAMIGVSFALVFGFIARSSAAKKKLLAEGVSGHARIVQVEGTGVRVNGQPMMELHLQVNVAGQSPYLAIHRELISYALMPRIAIGSNVGVRVDPSDPTVMAVDWQQM